MKTTSLKLLLSLFAFAAITLSSCRKDDSTPVDTNPNEIPEPSCLGVTSQDAIVLRFDYTNYAGEEPSVEIVTFRTDERIKYDATEFTPTIENNTMVIRIPNLRISDDNFNYTAECVTIEEFDETRPGNDRWFEQTEFKNQEEFSETNLATMLCLDVSSSLGEDREKVKQYAIDFAQQIIGGANSDSYVGLTLFADTVITYPFTNQISDIVTAINSFPYPDLNAQTFTRLSDGIIAGLEALDETTVAVDDKVLVAFTDGNDNGSDNPTGNQQAIKNSDTRRYMIGLKGKGLEYNTNYLKSLATNNKFFVEAENADDLQERFNDINELIANIYTIIYNRSPQTFDPDFDDPIQLRAIFYAQPYELDGN
jgi:hypothetical protein